ncbi:hypothetical protein HPB52_016952 [Rhipicephalus sanguineus]|uniref:Uncharacterized protein n=1 Tax=Rhipicephalus sanguineus TaxID=34632 RepID=A0A9D4PJY4_RHISA|nr:hypothetical protein HPB52_016952 [Rhipicephalus sanguineus]
MADSGSTSSTSAAGKGPRVSEGQRAMVLAFMEQHPQLALPAIDMGPNFTMADRRRQARQEVPRALARMKHWKGTLPGFRGRVLQLTGTLRLSGVGHLPYQEKHNIYHVVQQVWPLHVRPVRPPRRPRSQPRRVDTLSEMSAQCARWLEQGDEALEVLRRIEWSTTRLAIAAERTAAAQEAMLEEVRSLARGIGGLSLQRPN